MRARDDLTPASAPPRGRDDMVPRRPEDLRSPLLEGLRGLFRGLTWLSPLPVGRDRLLWVLPRPAGRVVADAYVVAWLSVLVGCVVLADGDAGPWVAGVALFRYGDLVATRAAVLLDPVGVAIGDARRTLVFAGLHLVELVLVTATVFRWQVGERVGPAVVTGMDVVTFQWPVRYAGNWLEAARVLAAAGVLLVAVSAVAAAVRVARER